MSLFFERSYGVIVFKEPNLKKNIYWKEVSTENSEIYWQVRNQIEQQDFILKGGDNWRLVKEGLKGVSMDLPV